MRKTFFTMLVLAFLSSLYSCSPNEPQEVDFTLNYTFVESGSMINTNTTRVDGNSVYNNFYEKHIQTKLLTPTTYSLTFKNQDKDEFVTIDGTWNENNGVRLPEGKYIVKGVSQPIEKELSYGYKYPSDTAYLIFEEEVSIEKDMSHLTLTANYDSFLLLFDATNTQMIKVMNQDKFLTCDDDNYWLFVRDKMYKSSNGSSTTYYFLDITRKNGDKINIELNNFPFEKGKYYYFNDMTNSFDIPKMESGN